MCYISRPFEGLQNDIVVFHGAEACKARYCGHVYVVKLCYDELYYLGIKGLVICPAPGLALICSTSGTEPEINNN